MNKLIMSQDGYCMRRVSDVKSIDILYNDDTDIADRLANIILPKGKEPENIWYEVTFSFDNEQTRVMAKYSTAELAKDALIMYTRFFNTDNYVFMFPLEGYVKNYFKK